MNKKVLALFAALFMIFSLVGCSTQGLSLIKELEKTSTWEAIEESGTFDLSLNMQEQEVKIGATYEAFTNSKDVQLEVTITPTVLEVAGTKMDLTKGEYKFSPVKVYMDGLKMYISTSYITDICRFAGVDAATIMDVSKDYIALDLADSMSASGMDLESIVNQSDGNLDIYKNLKVDGIIKQDGRKYTLDLTGEQMVDAVFGLVIESFNSQEAVLKETYKAMGLTDEEIEMVLAQVKSIYNEGTKAQIKPFVKDSKAQVAFEFADDKYTADYNLALNLNILDEKIAMNMTIKDTVKKASKKVITFPSSVTTYTMDDLMASAMASNSIPVAKADTVVQNGVNYVPVRATLAAVGITNITFEASTKTVALNDFGLSIPVVLVNDTAYTTVETFASLGVAVEIVD